MIYTPLTRLAMKIAYDAHHGQVDKTGTPYIFHPMHLAEMMDDEYSTCIALLHDTVEDTYITFEDLEKDFPKEVTDTLRLLTHKENEPYMEYIKRIKGNPLAEKVKRADIAHNSDFSRGKGIFTKETEAYLTDKYNKALDYLNEGLI